MTRDKESHRREGDNGVGNTRWAGTERVFTNVGAGIHGQKKDLECLNLNHVFAVSEFQIFDLSQIIELSSFGKVQRL